jgi:hypothetical protein
MLRNDGEYGIGSIDDVELYLVDEHYLTIAGPFLLPALLDAEKVRRLSSAVRLS